MLFRVEWKKVVVGRKFVLFREQNVFFFLTLENINIVLVRNVELMEIYILAFTFCTVFRIGEYLESIKFKPALKLEEKAPLFTYM